MIQNANKAATKVRELHISEVIVATADYQTALDFWCTLLGYSVLYQTHHTAPELLELWHVSADEIGRRALLGESHFHTRIQLVEVLHPSAPLKKAVGNLDALPKTLNLLVKDLPAVWQRLKNAGVTVNNDWVEYEAHGLRYRDAHITGPDNSGIGLLEVLDKEYLVNNLGIGEPASLACTVENMTQEATFYDQLGGRLELDEYFSGQAIEKLVGLPPGGSLHMQLFGPEATHSRIELVSYGIPMTSHYKNAKFPHTGVLFVHLAGGSFSLAADSDSTFSTVKVWNKTQQMLRFQSPAGATVILCK